MPKLKFIHSKFMDEETFSAFLGEDQIGEARVEYPGGKNVYLGGIELDESVHGKGFGKSFVKYIESYLKKKGIKKIYLSPNTTEAEGFWKHVGYKWDSDEQGAMSKKL